MMVYPDIGDTVRFENTATATTYEAEVIQLVINPPDGGPPLFIGVKSDGERVWGNINEIFAIDIKGPA